MVTGGVSGGGNPGLRIRDVTCDGDAPRVCVEALGRRKRKKRHGDGKRGTDGGRRGHSGDDGWGPADSGGEMVPAILGIGGLGPVRVLPRGPGCGG